MNLGATINHIRKSRGLKQGELAKLTGLTQTYLSLIEKNKREPNLTALKKIGNALSVPLPILFFLSLDESDIPKKKLESFEKIGPILKSILSQYFVDEHWENDKI